MIIFPATLNTTKNLETIDWDKGRHTYYDPAAMTRQVVAIRCGSRRTLHSTTC